MFDQPITYHDRATGRNETEKVYGEAFLRFTYGNPLGKLALHALVKRSIFSRWYGWRMDRAASKAKVEPFIREYGLDPAEFAEPPSSFQSFNEFFHRKLRPEARPIHPGETAAVFPADGRHLAHADCSKAQGYFVKGQTLGMAELLADAELAKRFERGGVLISRLCPVDYHRFHFPVAGRPGETRRIGGPLYSVNPLALRRKLRIFSENKRAYCVIDSPTFGNVVMMEVGATCVGGFEYTFSPGTPVEKGDEKGYFKFGGSSTITLFEPGRIQFAADLLEQTAQCRELYARMGDLLGASV